MSVRQLLKKDTSNFYEEKNLIKIVVAILVGITLFFLRTTNVQ